MKRIPEKIPSKIAEIRETQIPNYIYHYTSSAGIQGIISSQKIWMTKLTYLTDRTEFNFALQCLTDEIKSQLKNRLKTRSKEELNAMLKYLDGIETVNVSVASFTENGDQLSQWRGYCEIGNGYSLGLNGQEFRNYVGKFELSEDEFLGRKIKELSGFELIPCIYDEDEHKRIAKEIIDLSIPYFFHDKEMVITDNSHLYSASPVMGVSFDSAALRFAAIIKSPEFKEEKEWRLISSLQSYTEAKYRIGHFSLIPYWEFKINNNKAKLIDHIIIGPSPEPDLAKLAISGLLITNKYPLPDQKIINSKIPYRNI